MTNLLRVENLRVSAPGREGTPGVPILKDLSFEVGAGEILGVLGESGAGKSTILRAVEGILPGEFQIVGRILLRGENLLELGREQLRRRRGRELAMIFQEPLRHLNPARKVRRQLDMLLAFHRTGGGESGPQSRRRLLREVGLPATRRVEEAYPHELSGGMRQRLMIAMALAGDPSLLLADEPTTALDYPLQEEIVALLRRLAADRGMGVVYVSHDLRALQGVADRLLVILDGEMVEEGESETVLRSPRAAYTKRLLASAPSIDSRGDSLVARGERFL
ncbi:MAG: ATP-binding cassette domain-containing protein [Spirochaetaceae bacterium]